MKAEVDPTITADEIIELIENEGKSLASYMMMGDFPEFEARRLRDKIRERIEELDGV